VTPTHALVLAAGLGTRLRPLSEARAKPAMPVGGEPLVRRIIRWLSAQGVTNLVVNLHHCPASLTAVLGDGSDLGAQVRYSWEQPRVLGSAGGPRKALPLVAAETFFLVNGDTLAEVDLAALSAAHAAAGSLVTLALVPNRQYMRYGGVRIDPSGGIVGFSRRGAESKDSWHFVGVQIVDRSVFLPLTENEPANSIGGVYDALIRAQPGGVRAFCCDVPFWDIGTPGDYLRMASTWSTSGVEMGARAAIDPSAHISMSILWDDVEVGAGASLSRCIVGDGVQVPAGAQHESAILTDRDGELVITPFESES